MKVIFVGSFSDIKGGVGLACKTIIDNPYLSHVSWIKVDSAMKSLPPPHLVIRSWYALLRLIKFISLLFSRPKSVLIFSSSGGSMLEKGLMAILANIFGHRVTFCPRSGYTIDDLSASKLWRFYVKLVFSHCRYIVCQGESWKNTFKNYCSHSKLIVIPNLLSIDNYTRMPISPSSVGVIFISMFGWIEKNKGIFDLVEIVHKHKSDYHNVKIYICGHGSCVMELKQLILTYGIEDNFIIPGWIDGKEKFDILSKVHVHLLLSYREGLPNSLLEGMAAGKAIIATKVGAIPDVIQDGVSGLLCNAGDLEQIHNCLQSVIRNENLRIDLSANARRSFLQNFDLSTNGGLWTKVLD